MSANSFVTRALTTEDLKENSKRLIKKNPKNDLIGFSLLFQNLTIRKGVRHKDGTELTEKEINNMDYLLRLQLFREVLMKTQQAIKGIHEHSFNGVV